MAIDSADLDAGLLARYQDRWQQNKHSIVFYPLAEACREVGQLERAIELCRDGLVRHPYFWGARVVLGRTYLEQGQLDQAREELEKVVEVVPNNLLASKLLAQIYTGQGELAKAAHCYETIANFYPEDEEIYERYHYLLDTEVPHKKQCLKVLEQWRQAARDRYSSSVEANG